MQALNNNIKNIDAVLWTHAHADHANGIDDLRQFLWTRKEELPVYASSSTINALKNRFDYVFSKENNYFKPPLNINVVEQGKFSVCNKEAFAFNQIHGYEHTYGYKIGNFVYSTDVKEFPEESEKYLYNLDLWVVDCVRFEPHYSHSHFEQTISWIKKFKPKKALLTHLGAWLDYSKLKDLCPKGVEPAYDGLEVFNIIYVMRTNNDVIEIIIQILTSIDVKKDKDIINKADKRALLNYINEEFLNIDDYKDLLANITLEKEDILEILYQLLTLINIKSRDSENNISVTEQLIKEASKHGFTWPDSNSCFNKVEEEFLELKDAINKNDKKNIKEEIGDLLFTLHCYANIKKFNFENILK